MKRWLVKLYPRRWRDRYGTEFEALLDAAPLRASDVINVVWAAGCAHADLRRRGLRWIGSATTAVSVEWYAASQGIADNILWLPRDTVSAALVTLAAGSLAVTLAPLVRLLVSVLGLRRFAA